MTTRHQRHKLCSNSFPGGPCLTLRVPGYYDAGQDRAYPLSLQHASELATVHWVITCSLTWLETLCEQGLWNSTSFDALLSLGTHCHTLLPRYTLQVPTDALEWWFLSRRAIRIISLRTCFRLLASAPQISDSTQCKLAFCQVPQLGLLEEPQRTLS